MKTSIYLTLYSFPPDKGTNIHLAVNYSSITFQLSFNPFVKHAISCFIQSVKTFFSEIEVIENEQFDGFISSLPELKKYIEIGKAEIKKLIDLLAEGLMGFDESTNNTKEIVSCPSNLKKESQSSKFNADSLDLLFKKISEILNPPESSEPTHKLNNSEGMEVLAEFEKPFNEFRAIY